jgi:hypothetical protein
MPLLTDARAQGRWPTQLRGGGPLGSHGVHVLPTRRPFRHFTEQVACSEMAGVGRVFGLVLGRFRAWAKNEDRSSR